MLLRRVDEDGVERGRLAENCADAEWIVGEPVVIPSRIIMLLLIGLWIPKRAFKDSLPFLLSFVVGDSSFVGDKYC